MKSLLRGIPLLILSNSVWAQNHQDYQTTLEKIQERQKSIDQKMTQLGFTQSAATMNSLSGKTTGEPARLFQTHDHRDVIRIPAGTLLFGKTYLRLVVGSETTPAMILLDDGQGRFSGLKVLGKAHASSADGRLLLDLDRIMLSSGQVITVQGSALDSSGAYGLEAEVWSHKVWASLGAVASGFASGAATAYQSTTTNGFGFSQTQPTGRNAILQGLAQSAADQSKKLLDDATHERPILTLEADTPVTVLISEEVRQ